MRSNLKYFLMGIFTAAFIFIMLGFTQKQEKRISEYTIVTDENILELTKKVKPYLENDYKLLGGVFVIYNPDNSKHVFYQTLTR